MKDNENILYRENRKILTVLEGKNCRWCTPVANHILIHEHGVC